MPYCGDPWCGHCGRYGRLAEEAEMIERDLRELQRALPTDRKARVVAEAKIGTLRASAQKVRNRLADRLREDAEAREARERRVREEDEDD